jgi:hypothetical protein
MAKNERLVLRTEASELYKKTKLKISPTNTGSILTSSITTKDINLLLSRGFFGNQVAGFFDRDAILTNATFKNQAALVSNVNLLRDIIAPNSDDPTIGSSSPLLSKIPVHKHINETQENLERLSIDYSSSTTAGSRLSNLKFMKENFFDPGYAIKMFNLGRATEVSPDTNNRLYSTDQLNVSGYIKVEDASPSIQLDLIIRGVPVRMRKTETSDNFNGTKNYVFTYPQYLINTAESVRSIQYVDVIGRGDNAKIFYGTDHSFPVLQSDEDYINLSLFNKLERNIQ